jgi:hypothetical protein
MEYTLSLIMIIIYSHHYRGVVHEKIIKGHPLVNGRDCMDGQHTFSTKVFFEISSHCIRPVLKDISVVIEAFQTIRVFILLFSTTVSH